MMESNDGKLVAEDSTKLLGFVFLDCIEFY